MNKCSWKNAQQTELTKFLLNNKKRKKTNRTNNIYIQVGKATVIRQKINRELCSYTKGKQSSDCSVLTLRQEKTKKNGR